ncbi:MAG: type I methionyl aminopeptidase [Caldiserica bacterium]|nr:MAG: type I methionyl aminopeptidase [Caldisericota bacterium]
MIILKSKAEIEIMRRAGMLLAEVMEELKKMVKEGVSAYKLNEFAEKKIRSLNAEPAFKGYRGYPYTLCVSVNSEVVHGFPSKEKVFKDGDLVSLDIGLKYKGYYSDMAFTVPVGEIDKKKRKLLEVGERALYLGISKAKVGNRRGVISNAIEEFVKENGFSVVKEYVGHGIGRSLHEDPQVPNFGDRSEGPVLKEGMTIAIEPMICIGSGKTKVEDDGWTAKTVDDGPCVHFEHTIAITAKGPLILTVPEEVR